MAIVNLWSNTTTGPTYATGGYTVATSLTTVTAADVDIQTPGANLGRVNYIVIPNTPAGGFTVKIYRRNFDLLSFGSPTGLPAGVSNQVTSGQTVASESSHTHDAAHDHAVSSASATMSGGSGQVTQAVTGGVATSTHTHTVNLPNFALTTGAGSSHNHTWDNIYQHQHSITNTTTDLGLTELANGTDLSGATINYVAVGAA